MHDIQLTCEKNEIWIIIVNTKTAILLCECTTLHMMYPTPNIIEKILFSLQEKEKILLTKWARRLKETWKKNQSKDWNKTKQNRTKNWMIAYTSSKQ